MKTLGIRAIGRLSEPWLKEAVHMYEKRLDPHGGIEVVELPEGHKGSAKPDEQRTMKIEAESLLKSIPKDAFVVALDRRGKTTDSPAFASSLEYWSAYGRQVIFLIGGSWGLDDVVKERADALLSFGPMTFTHGLARVILLEQLYRAKMIKSGKEYHK